MKTSVEISGYLITIEEVDGVISVNAAKDDEVVEEFTISVQESDDEFAEEGGEMGDVKPFGDYDEEEDFGEEEDDIQDQIDEEPENDEIQGDDDDDDDDDDDNDNDDELSLESFQAFINKKPASKRK